MSLVGCVDTLAGTCISGWAADDSDFGRRVDVEVAVNSQIVATVPCTAFREDLRAAGIGDGCKAFECDPSAHLIPGRNRIEVRYAGVDSVVPQGCGHWVIPRPIPLSGWRAVIAALEAHWDFLPHHDICAVGIEADAVERLFLDAHLPFRHVLGQWAEKADVLIWWLPFMPDSGSVRLALEHVRTPGLVAMGVCETPGVSSQIRRAFAGCGISELMLESIPSGPGLPGVLALQHAGCVASPSRSGPVLAHIHVPKCAGTSFRVLLERYFGPRHVRLYVNDTYFVYGDEALRNYLLRDPGIVGFSSHHVRSFPRWVAGREILYVTFLRDPVEQFISYMTHIRKLYSTITSESLLAAVPPDAPRLTLREFARWLLTSERDIPFRENHNVNFFARHSSPVAAERLQAAKGALEDFFFVGIAERMEESVAELRVKAAAAGLDFPPGPVPFENTSADYRDDLSWIHPGDEVGSLLLRSIELDRELYKWALARFDAPARRSSQPAP